MRGLSTSGYEPESYRVTFNLKLATIVIYPPHSPTPTSTKKSSQQGLGLPS